MNYIQGNKEAWEEAFENRKEGWGEQLISSIQEHSDAYLQPAVKLELNHLIKTKDHIAQFCCNNGRELLSISKHYGVTCTGFDIAENMIFQATQSAQALKLPCTFYAKNILEITSEFDHCFDLVLFTIGAITWFEDLDVLFHVVARCLKPGGILLLHDFHPVMNMLPLPGDEDYCAERAALLEHKYFTKEPWIETNGMSYMSEEYASKTFTSYSHAMSHIVNSAIRNGMSIQTLKEFDYDVGLTDVYDHMGIPLSMLLVAKA